MMASPSASSWTPPQLAAGAPPADLQFRKNAMVILQAAKDPATLPAVVYGLLQVVTHAGLSVVEPKAGTCVAAVRNFYETGARDAVKTVAGAVYQLTASVAPGDVKDQMIFSFVYRGTSALRARFPSWRGLADAMGIPDTGAQGSDAYGREHILNVFIFEPNKEVAFEAAQAALAKANASAAPGSSSAASSPSPAEGGGGGGGGIAAMTTAIVHALGSAEQRNAKSTDASLLKALKALETIKAAAGLLPTVGSPRYVALQTAASAVDLSLESSEDGKAQPTLASLPIPEEVAAQYKGGAAPPVDALYVSLSCLDAAQVMLQARLSTGVDALLASTDPLHTYVLKGLRGSMVAVAASALLDHWGAPLGLTLEQFLAHGASKTFGVEAGVGYTASSIIMATVRSMENDARRAAGQQTSQAYGINAMLASKAMSLLQPAVNSGHARTHGTRGPETQYGTQGEYRGRSVAPYGYILYLALCALAGGVVVLAFTPAMLAAVNAGVFMTQRSLTAELALDVSSGAARAAPGAAEPAEGGAAGGAAAVAKTGNPAVKPVSAVKRQLRELKSYKEGAEALEAKRAQRRGEKRKRKNERTRMTLSLAAAAGLVPTAQTKRRAEGAGAEGAGAGGAQN